MSTRSGSQVPRAMAITAAVVGVIFVLVGWFVPVRDRLVVVGDSITLVSAPALRAELSGEHVVDIRAWLGITAPGMRDQVRSVSTRGIDVAVIDLGSNDVLKGEPLDATGDALEEYVDFFRAAGASCVHLVNISTGMRAAGVTPVGEQATELNERIQRIADEFPDVVVVDWDARVREVEASGAESLVPDTVHPSVPRLARIVALTPAPSRWSRKARTRSGGLPCVA